MGAEDLNSGPLACTVGILPDELFLEASNLTSQEKISRDKAVVGFVVVIIVVIVVFLHDLKYPVFIPSGPAYLKTKYWKREC